MTQHKNTPSCLSAEPNQLAVASTTSANRRLPQAACIEHLLTGEIAPLDFVLPGLVRGTVGAIIGPGGVGKSYWAMQLCLSIASGVDLTGLAPKVGRAIYFSAEDPEQIHAQRLRDMTRQAPSRVVLGQALDLRLLMNLGVDLMDAGWFDQLLGEAQGRELVVFDTLTRFHNLDENSALDMKRLMAQLERLAENSGAAVLFLHHTSKAAAVAGLGGTQQAARGSSVLVDNARWACFLAGMTQQEAKIKQVSQEDRSSFVRWNISKQNYGCAVPDVWYQRVEGGVLVACGEVLPPAATSTSTAVRTPAPAPALTIKQPVINKAQKASPAAVPAAAAVDGADQATKPARGSRPRKIIKKHFKVEDPDNALTQESLAEQGATSVKPIESVPGSATNAFQGKW